MNPLFFWGDMQIVDNLPEMKHGMKTLLYQLEEKNSLIKEKILASDKSYSKMEILKLKIRQIHGKAGR